MKRFLTLVSVTFILVAAALYAQSTQQTATKTFTLTVVSAVTVSTTALPSAVVGNVYSVTLVATGGTGSYAWSVSSGALPAGISLSAAGVLGGSPTASGSFSFTVQAKDSSGNTGTRALTLVVASPLSITTSTIPPIIVGVPYSFTLSATGGTAPYTWSVSAGTLPAGITLSPAGVLSGTATAPGSSDVTFEVTDSGK